KKKSRRKEKSSRKKHGAKDPFRIPRLNNDFLKTYYLSVILQRLFSNHRRTTQITHYAHSIQLKDATPAPGTAQMNNTNKALKTTALIKVQSKHHSR
ncbi:hypothetical protein, partial [Ruegeria halocynthiae]|uniref:hypothetical protein n=1 Tax=Ruegeria halocynthiae TaxID=985054 RepID=UPI001F4187FD